jgi:hypothetical protein
MGRITISELAARLCRPNEEFEVVASRLRNWTSTGLLTPVGERFTGAGRARFYDEPGALNALVLTGIATDCGMQAVRGSRFNSAILAISTLGFEKYKENRDRYAFNLLIFSAKYLPKPDILPTVSGTGEVFFASFESEEGTFQHVHGTYDSPPLQEWIHQTPIANYEGCSVLNLNLLFRRFERCSQHHLFVRAEFGQHKKGDRIFDPGEIASVLKQTDKRSSIIEIGKS